MKSRLNGADIHIGVAVWPALKKELVSAQLNYNNEAEEEDEISLSGFIRLCIQKALPLIREETKARREARLAKKTKKTEG